MGNSRKSVFVSSTSQDLRSYRLLVKDALLKGGVFPIAQDTFPPDYRQLKQFLEDQIRECDAVICLVGFAFGDAPKQPPDIKRRSYTQIEYDLAKVHKPVYVFVATEKCLLDEQPQESDEERENQRQFRNELEPEHKCTPFSSPEELHSLVSQIIPKTYAEVSRAPAEDLRAYLRQVRSWRLNPYIPLNATRNQDSLRSSDILTMLKREIGAEHSPVIVGGPDSGRTVVLRQFAQSLIPRTNDTRPIPVWVDVKPYRATERFKDYLWRWLDSDKCPDFYESIRSSLQHYINSGHVLWLLDGIDAGSPEDFRRRLQKVWEFKNHRPANHCVLACRYDYELPNKDWPILLRLRELDDRQIDGFLRNMTRGLDLVKLKSRPDLLDLCRNPGGLHRLVTSWNRNGHLPLHLGHLYKEFLQDLIERAVPPGPEVPLLLDLLSKIALTMAKQGRNGSDIPLADLRAAGALRSSEDDRRVDSSVEGGLLKAEPKTGSIGFADHKFEDCLAARALEDRLRSPDGPKMIETCLGDYALREILTNAVTTSDNSSELVDQIVNHALQRPQKMERILSAAECVQHASPAVREMYGFKLLPQLRKAASPYGRE